MVEKSTVSERKASFALPNAQMFINTIIQRVSKEKEVTIVTVSGNEHTGFITGIDEEWCQITSSEEQQLVLLNLLNIESVEETGKSLSTIELGEEAKERIKIYSSTVFVKAREIIRAGRPQRSRYLSRASAQLVGDNLPDEDDLESEE